MEAFMRTGKLGQEKKKDNKAGPSTTKKNLTIPWVEKYRPKTVDDVVEQVDVISVMKECMNGADLPHLLFYGPPGTGKTSTILAAARELFGDIYKARILELNASDERGIQVIRDKVKGFAQQTASGFRPDGRPCPPFKIIILDEADSMTENAQAALRRTMELETKSTRFCLICNYVSRIIDPLTSRCTKFRFKPLKAEMMRSRLEYIAEEENVLLEEKVLDYIIETSGGDMRRAITLLQSCCRLKGKDQKVANEDVSEVSGVVPDQIIKSFLQICQNNDYDILVKNIENLIKEAYCASQFMEQIHDEVIQSDYMSDNQKALILEKLGLCSYRLQEGTSEYIELLDLGCTILQAYQM